MKILGLFIIIFFLSIRSLLSLESTHEQPDSTVNQSIVSPTAASSLLKPDSIRITAYSGEFRWRHFYYEAELQVSIFYPTDNKAFRPDSQMIFVNFKTPGAALWIRTGEDDYVKRDYLIQHINELQATGKIRWSFTNSVKLEVKADGCKKKELEITVNIPMLLLLVAMFGGLLGGWLRRSRDPNSVINIHIRVLPEKWSRRIEPIREILISIIVGMLLYLINLISPIYLGFRAENDESWHMLLHPLIIGFIGGWGGINLLINILNNIFSATKTNKAKKVISTTKS